MADNIYTGTLDLLILQSLSHGPKHGYRIVQWIHDRSSKVLEVGEAALYPALHRLDRKGFISGEWGVTDRGRRARIYTLTKKGRKKLAEGAARWDAHAQAVYALLRTEEG